MLETLDYTIRIGSTPTFLYFDLYLYSAYAAHCVLRKESRELHTNYISPLYFSIMKELSNSNVSVQSLNRAI